MPDHVSPTLTASLLALTFAAGWSARRASSYVRRALHRRPPAPARHRAAPGLLLSLAEVQRPAVPEQRAGSEHVEDDVLEALRRLERGRGR